MPTDLVGQLIIYIVVLLLAISAHEAAHAWMSHKFGDDTAYLLGRVTLNLVPHIGWGKPTPVNPLRWRNKDLANVMVSLAGIMANLLLALIGFVILKVCVQTGLIGLGVVGRFGSFEE